MAAAVRAQTDAESLDLLRFAGAAPQRRPGEGPLDLAPVSPARRHRSLGDCYHPPLAVPVWMLPASPFPTGRRWEVSRATAWSWFQHRFWGLTHSEDFIERADIGGHELLLLVYDLDYYEAACERYLRDRGPCPKPLDEYLRPGREHWGSPSGILRALAEAGEIGTEAYPHTLAAAAPEPAEEMGEHELRDAAICALDLDGVPPLALMRMDVGDVDLEGEQVRCRDRWRPISEAAAYVLECYLDERPELEPGLPLFTGRNGERMSVRQVQRVVGKAA